MQGNGISAVTLFLLATVISVREYDTFIKGCEERIVDSAFIKGEDNSNVSAISSCKDQESLSDYVFAQSPAFPLLCKDVKEKDSKKGLETASKIVEKKDTVKPLPFVSLLKNKENEVEVSKTVFITSGNTLASILGGVGVTPREVSVISKKLSKFRDPRSLQIGQKVDLELSCPEGQVVKSRNQRESFDFYGEPRLCKMILQDKLGNRLIVRRTEDGFEVEKEDRPVKVVTKGINAVIETNISDAALAHGVPKSVSADMVRAINSVTDPRRLRRGNSFSVIYEENRAVDTGEVVGRRVLRCVSVTTEGRTYNLFNFGNNKFYNEKGETAVSEFLALPLENKNVRVSSRFGYRIHPIFQTKKYHTGIDYAAKYGTAVRAAADGTVIKAGRLSGYGLYLRLRHSHGYETAYAHMSSIVVKKGDRVRQGDLIGRVGSSGRATGAHLHHEVICNNRFVDPQKCYKLGGRKLTGVDYQKFRVLQKTYSAKLSELTRKQATQSEAV